MAHALLTARERLIWLAGFLAVAGLLVAARFVSQDADSVRYATLSARLSALPVARWVAPEWWGLTTTDLSGYFLEHPAGLFVIPAAMGRFGVPAEQAPYIFGVAAGLLALVLTAQLVGRLTTREDGRVALVLLQIMPMAFIFRIRDNHEYPMLVCLLAVFIGLDRVSQSWSWISLVVLGFVGGLLIKGVFVAIVAAGAVAWILINPTRGSRARQLAACLCAAGCMILVAVAYDAWYVRQTGGPFWSAYLDRQLGPMHVASPIGQVRAFGQHIGFYLVLLLFHPAPWSLALLWAAWPRGRLRAQTDRERRGLRFVLVFAVVTVLSLSLASRFAERYAFSVAFLVGAAGVVVASRAWPGLKRGVDGLNAAVPGFPAVVWTLLIVLRLALGPSLPRVGG